MICFQVAESKSPVGLSANITSGCLVNAQAMNTHYICPPLNVVGYCLA